MAVITDYDGRIDTTKHKPSTIPQDAYGLDTIYITACGYVNYPIYGISPESKLAFDDRVWGADLERSTNLVLSNILDVNYGLVARIEVSFPYLNIETYKVLCNIIKERVCRITYFNREKAEWVESQEFSVTEYDIGQVYNKGNDYFGVLDMKISLVATNRDRVGIIEDEYTISYFYGERSLNDEIGDHYYVYEEIERNLTDDDGNIVVDDDGNNVTETIQQITEASKAIVDGYTMAKWGFTTTIIGTEFMQDDAELKSKKFVEWNTKADGSGGHYFPNEIKTMWENIDLYAIFEDEV